MSFSWTDIAGEIADWAPAIATVLGGPAGVAVGAAGAVLSSVLGSENNPDAIAKAITADPEAAAKIRQAELDHAEEMRSLAIKAAGQQLEAATAQQSRTSHVMIAELKANGLYKSGWRALVGYAFALGVIAIIGALCYTLVTDPQTVDSVVNGIIWIMVTVAPVLGVNISRDHRLRETLKTGQPALGIGQAIAQRIAGTQGGSK